MNIMLTRFIVLNPYSLFFFFFFFFLLQGTYYPLQGMSDTIGDDLRSQGFLFQV